MSKSDRYVIIGMTLAVSILITAIVSHVAATDAVFKTACKARGGEVISNKTCIKSNVLITDIIIIGGEVL